MKKIVNQTSAILLARQIVLSGQVQGVGFRPFIYRLAVEHQLTGWVRNGVGSVEIFVQGQSQNLQTFLTDIFDKKPPLAKPKLESDSQTDVDKFDAFSILQSQSQGEAHISVPADLFLCDDCLTELNRPSDRRYHYPFINCTQCGPRYTLIRSLPYDRPNTTMVDFELCSYCFAEYKDPCNRRFHAEPVACAECGPSLTFKNKNSEFNDNAQDDTSDNNRALKNAVELLRQGRVVAVKGIGGYHLMCDACNTGAVSRLRNNKPRPHKPLAVMFPSPAANPFEYAEKSVTLSDSDKTFLLQPARPILLVAKKEDVLLVEKPSHTELSEYVLLQHALPQPALSEHALSQHVAPGLNEVGIMLPYSPLHHLLLNEFAGPLVATSANISGEPVLIHDQQVEKRLGHVSDAFLHHNRPIERPADDPVYRTIAGKARPIRSGRGFAPIELTLPFELEKPILAVGAQMKNTVALAWKNRVIISPHIGEMNTARSLEVFEHTVNDLQKLYDVKAELIVCDAHPGYTTTRWANRQDLPVYRVYHHQAHASATYYECNTEEAVIAFTWDGVGYGEDGSLWGGETFLGKPGQWQRVASMRPFNLPGGDKAGREPWRCAAALCWEAGLVYEKIPEKDPMRHSMLRQAWQRKINAPQSSSVGRLFDAAAALTGVRTMASFEGQGPMELEALCDCLAEKTGHKSNEYIKLDLEMKNNVLITNWKPLITGMLDSALSVSTRASLFHASLAHCILQQATKIRDSYGVNTVSFSGGVFQNRVLTEHAIVLLSDDGFKVCLPELIPVNDAGISFGQVMEYGFKKYKGKR